MRSKHVIEILHTERCQFLGVTLERVRHALFARADEVEAEVRITQVSTFGEALARRFRGSPTVRIDGVDVEARRGAVAPIGLLARGYLVEGRIERAPTVQTIQLALDAVVGNGALYRRRPTDSGSMAVARTL